MSTIILQKAQLESFAGDRDRLEVGDRVRIAVQFSQTTQGPDGLVTVDPNTGQAVLEPAGVSVNTFGGSRVPL